ncbi:Rho termination factor N-terminal domain-containing protein, partial [Legionella pneumophila]
MNLSELKQLPIADLVNIAQEMGVENTSRMRKQDIIFAILKA